MMTRQMESAAKPIRIMHDIFGPTRIFHAPEVFIGEAFKGDAVIVYCEPVITKPMDTSGSARRVKSFLLFSNIFRYKLFLTCHG